MNSQEFHNKYYYMYDKLVKVTLKDGNILTGSFCDEFFEDNSIMVSHIVIKIIDIDTIELLEK